MAEVKEFWNIEFEGMDEDDKWRSSSRFLDRFCTGCAGIWFCNWKRIDWSDVETSLLFETLSGF